MKRKLMRQIINEWRSNIWLALELLIVSVVMWYVTDSLFVSYSILNEPRGFNTDHCYFIRYNDLSGRSADYKEWESRKEMNDDFLKFFELIASRPEIEAAGLGQNAFIYNNSNSNTHLTYDSLDAEVIRRWVSPEYPLVFRVEGANGETPEELSRILRDEPHALLASDNFLAAYGIESASDYIGKEFGNWANGDTVRLLATYKPIRYNDYISAKEKASWSMLYTTACRNYSYFNEMFVRVKENMDHDFIENIMKDAQTNLRVGNWYIANVQSFDDIRNFHQQSQDNKKRNMYVVMIFLAVNIFLGLLGTFWFRTRARVSEIAIRKANGASSADIFRRVVGEGIMLLLLITPFAALIDWGLTYYEFNPWYDGYFGAWRFSFCVILTFVMMSVMIILGTAIPAYRAMKLQPAVALKEE